MTNDPHQDSSTSDRRISPFLETAALTATVLAIALPSLQALAAFLVLAVLWALGRPPRLASRIFLPMAGLVLLLIAAGSWIERREPSSMDQWLSLASESFEQSYDAMVADARWASTTVGNVRADSEDALEAFNLLQDLSKRPRFSESTLVLLDRDGVAEAWAGPGLLHEPPSHELPAQGVDWRRGYSTLTLFVVEPVPSGGRLLLGQSFSSLRFPFTEVPAPKPVKWTLATEEAVSDAFMHRSRAGAPVLVIAERAPDPHGEREEELGALRPGTLYRMAELLLGLVLLALSFIRGLLPLVGGGRCQPWSATVLTLAGTAALAGAMGISTEAMLAVTLAAGLATFGLLRPLSFSAQSGGGWLGAVGVLGVVASIWWLQVQGYSQDLAADLIGSADAMTLRLIGCLLCLGLLRIAGGRQEAATGERGAVLPTLALLTAAALHDVPLLALPFLFLGGAWTARWLRGTDFRHRPLALATAVLLAAVTSATAWEMTYRERFRDRLAEHFLPRVVPPSLDETNALHLRIHRSFDGFELEEVMPPGLDSAGPKDVDPDDLAYLLWRRSPLAERDGASALQVQLADGTRSVFAFGLPQSAVDDSENWPVPAIGAWREAAIAGKAELRFEGRPWGAVDYTFIPRPGFRLEIDELAELESTLVRGPHGRAIDGLPRSVLFGIYHPDGQAIASPWRDSPPLPSEVLAAHSGTVTLPTGRFWYWAADAPQLVEVLFLPRLSPLAALERVGIHALGALLLLLALIVLVALPRSLGGVRELANEMLSSYSIRLMMVYTALLLIPLVALNLVLLRGFEQRLRENQQESGHAALTSARLFLRDHLQGLEPGFGIETKLNSELLEWVSGLVRHQVNLYWGSEILASSQTELFSAGLLPRRIPGTVFKRLALLGHDVGSRVRTSDKVTYLELYTPLQAFGSQGLFLSVPLLAQEEEVERELERFARQAMVVTAALFLMLMAVGARLARSLTTPIMALIDGTREIARGAPFLAVTPRERELARLADAIDEMARRIAESRRQLVAEKQVVDRMVENVNSGVVSLDHQQRVLLHNRLAADLLGVEVGTSLKETLQAQEHLQLVEQFVQLASAERDLRSETVRVASSEEGREWTMTWVPLPGPENPAALLVVEDRTEVLRGQRLAAWAEMARIIAHEIKNPLTPIRLSTEHMQMVYRSDPERLDEVFERCTSNILDQVEELRDIASDFSIYSRLPRAERLDGDLVATARELTEVYRTNQDDPSAVRLVFTPEATELPAQFDSKLLGRALRNLLENAFRASPPGGEVSLTVSQAEKQALITVQDQGPGVPAENLQRIFEPYFSTHETGTGLGLAIVQRIVGEHGGKLEARNHPGGGLQVVITIPLTE